MQCICYMHFEIMLVYAIAFIQLFFITFHIKAVQQETNSDFKLAVLNQSHCHYNSLCDMH